MLARHILVHEQYSVALSALTLLAYFSLMLSSIATALYLEKSSGDI